MDTFIITCEHGSNRIPAPYRRLFRGQAALLDSHRGYDPVRWSWRKHSPTPAGRRSWRRLPAACLSTSIAPDRTPPYAGRGDGLTSRLRLRFAPSDYVGIELEVNQGIVLAADRRWTVLQRVLIDSSRTACGA